jgi:hypothetical protein
VVSHKITLWCGKFPTRFISFFLETEPKHKLRLNVMLSNTGQLQHASRLAGDQLVPWKQPESRQKVSNYHLPITSSSSNLLSRHDHRSNIVQENLKENLSKNLSIWRFTLLVQRDLWFDACYHVTFTPPTKGTCIFFSVWIIDLIRT